MNVKDKLKRAKQLVEEAMAMIEWEEHQTKISNFYSSNIRIKGKQKYNVHNVTLSVGDNHYTLTPGTEDLCIHLENIYRSALKNLGFQELLIWAKPIIKDKKFVHFEAFIMVTQPEFKLETMPKVTITLGSWTPWTNVKRYQPSVWSKGLYCGSVIPFDELYSLLNRLTNIQGFHFNDAEYTHEQYKNLKILLNKFTNIPNPIWEGFPK